MAQMSPVMDFIDTDKMVKHLADILGVPSKVVRSANEVMQIRKQRAEAQQAQAQAQQDMQTAEAGGKVAPLVRELNRGQ
jgi:Zn-dependent peptidase ImmA (M78 family)